MFFKFPKLEKWQDIAMITDELNRNDFSVKVLEKLDGMHIGIYVPTNPESKIEIYTRNGVDMCHSEELSYIYTDISVALRKFVANSVSVFRHYKGMYFDGELCGIKIANRIDYGCKLPHKDNFIKLYTVGVVNDENMLEDISSCCDIVTENDMLYPYVLQPISTLEVGNTFSGLELPAKSSIYETSNLEGYVYYFIDDNIKDILILKKHKDGLFNDRKIISDIPMSSTTKAIREIYLSYITDNRALDVLSKHDKSVELKYHVGLFINEVFNDAWIDFKQDHKDMIVNYLTAKEKRQVRQHTDELRDMLVNIFNK